MATSSAVAVALIYNPKKGQVQRDISDINHEKEPFNSDVSDVEDRNVNIDKKETKLPFIDVLQTDRTEPPDRSFWLKLCIIFFTLDSLLLTVILLHQFGIEKCRRGNIKDNDFCLPCMDMYLTRDDYQDNIYGYAKRGDICCALEEKYATHMVEKFVMKKSRRDMALDVFAKRGTDQSTSYLPSAHLVLAKQKSTSDAAPLPLLWDHTNSESIIGRNISYEDGKLKIHQSGIYYLYSQITFQNNRTDQSLVISHKLFRVKSGGDVSKSEKLMERVHSPCMDSSDKSYLPSYLGAVFRLEREDTIFVSVSHPQHGTDDNVQHYFGLYMI